MSERSSPLFHLEFLQKTREESKYKLKGKQELARVTIMSNTVTQQDWTVNIPRIIFSSLGSRVRTGGASIWSISWSSQIMLSSQRPYTNSSLSMGKMENQGGSSSWDAAYTQIKITIHKIKRHFYIEKNAWRMHCLYIKVKKCNSPWLSWLLFSRLEPEIKGILGMGGGVGGTIWELLLVRPEKLFFAIISLF